jgi:hemerythrin-like domain-containing protein
MRALNHAIEEAAMFNDMMEKIAPQRAGGMFVMGENGRQYVPGENREQRRRREQAEKRAAKAARKVARA